MPAVVPLNQNEIADEKIQTATGELHSLIASENLLTTTSGTQKPEAIVRPLRRREPSDDDNRSPDVEELEAQIIDKLSKLEKPQKFQKQLSKEGDRKTQQSRDSKRSLKEALSDESIIKRPLFITTVPRGIFLQPQPIVREIVAKTRHVYAYASHPRILHVEHKNRREILSKQSSINNSYNQLLHRNVNLINKNIKTFDDQVDGRFDKADDGLYKMTGVKIPTRTRESQPCQNLMFDRRVVRGSNFASTNLQAGDNEILRKEEEAKRRQLLRKRQVSRNQRGVIGTPPPVRGRKHETIQTEKYLEELFSRPPEIEQSCQTDLFLQRPETPVYVTARVGVDASTEICDGELFDFDKEVQSVLETFVGTTLQQALTEVMHEEEVADLREQQHKMLAVREAEMAELRRLENKEKSLQSEKERRKFEDDERDITNLQLNERITAAKLLQGHIADLLPSVLESIESVREAENKEDLQQKLTPWLAEEVASEIGQMVDSQELLLEIVKEVLQHRAEIYAKIDEDDKRDEDDI